MKHLYLSIIIVFFYLDLCAQSLTPNFTFFNSGDTVYIQPGALLYVGDDPDNGEFGDLVIRGDSTVPGQGVIYNDGVIALTGNLFSGDTVNGISYGNPKFDTVKGVFYTVPPSVIKERMVVFRGDDNNQVIKGYLDQPEASFFNLGIDKDPSQIGASVVLGSNVRVRGSLIWNPNQSGITASTYDQSGSIAMTDYLSGGGYGRIKTYRNNKDYELYISNPDTASIVNYSTFSINTSDALKIVENRGVQGVGLGGLSREIGYTSKYYAFPVGTNLRGNNGVLLNFSSLPPSGSRKVRGMFVNVNGSVGSVNYALYATSYPCNGGFPHWFEFNTFLNDHGYWSFDADQNNLNHYKYVIYTFPNGLSTSEYDLLMSGDNMRVLKYNASVVDTPNGDWSPWVGGIGNDTQNLINYTFFDTSVACYNNPFNGIPGGEYNDFSHFGIGGSGSSSLPIELLTLKAYPVKNEFIRVDWVTASEINNEKFEVYRSQDGVNFIKIGEVKGKGTTTEFSQYYFDDKNVLPNITYYYRLKQIDFDGKHEFSKIVSAAITGSESVIISEFIPNPAIGNSKILITSPTDLQLDVNLYNPLGQEIQAGKLVLTAGVQTPFVVDASTLAAGNYVLLLRNDNLFVSRRLIVTTR